MAKASTVHMGKVNDVSVTITKGEKKENKTTQQVAQAPEAANEESKENNKN